MNTRWPVACIAAALLAAVLTPSAAPAESPGARQSSPPTTARVLILTGEDYKGHKWQETTPVLKRQIAADSRLSVTVVEDLKKLGSLELDRYDAIVMHFKNYDPAIPGEAGWKNLQRYVGRGGGLVLVHFACGAFQEWPGFVELAGRVWNPKLRGHDPRGKFRVEITEKKHPITEGMKGFETTDELYTCLDGNTPIEVLATSVSKVDGKVYPMAFVLSYGKGRVFHCLLGHDVVALEPAAVGELFRRGTVWAAKLPVQPPKK